MKRFLMMAVALFFASLAMAQAAPNQAQLSWTPGTVRSDGTTVPAAAQSFNIYQGVKGAAKTKVGTVTATTNTLNVGLLSNTEYCWQVTAFETTVGASSESAMSNEGCKKFGAATVGTVTLTVQ